MSSDDVQCYRAPWTTWTAGVMLWENDGINLGVTLFWTPALGPECLPVRPDVAQDPNRTNDCNGVRIPPCWLCLMHSVQICGSHCWAVGK